MSFKISLDVDFIEPENLNWYVSEGILELVPQKGLLTARYLFSSLLLCSSTCSKSFPSQHANFSLCFLVFLTDKGSQNFTAKNSFSFFPYEIVVLFCEGEDELWLWRWTLAMATLSISPPTAGITEGIEPSREHRTVALIVYVFGGRPRGSNPGFSRDRLVPYH